MPSCAKQNSGNPPSEDRESDMNTASRYDHRHDNSHSTAAPVVQGPARQYHARLLMGDGRRYCALTDEGAIWVEAAAGCLLQPRVGDIALVSVAGATGYVLAVLERADTSGDAVLAVPGNGLRVEAGKIDIHADASLTLSSGAQMQLNARTAGMLFERLNVEGVALHARWTQRVEVNIQRIDIAERAECHWGYSVRRIGTHEEVTAASMRHVIDRDWAVRAGSAALLGRDRVAIDGNAVQIG